MDDYIYLLLDPKDRPTTVFDFRFFVLVSREFLLPSFSFLSLAPSSSKKARKRTEYSQPGLLLILAKIVAVAVAAAVNLGCCDVFS